jgi:tetratricopeptide (TPR) repeat protein
VLLTALALAIIGAASQSGPGMAQRAASSTAASTQPSIVLQPEPTPTPLAPTSTATPALAILPTITPAPPTPTPALFAPAGPSARLSGLRHEWQTWNNCGPATLAMLLSFFGSSLDQAAVGSVLRLSPDDKNVSPQEMADYARGQGYSATLLIDGSADLLRTLVSNGIPVLVETWHEAEPNDGLGHYRLVVGYDDAAQQWLLYDSYDASNLVSSDAYQGIQMAYPQLEAWWKVFNRAMLLIYPPEKEALVGAILAGHDDEPDEMWQAAALRAEDETLAAPDDAFAWFNLGSSLTSLGRFEEAANAFDRARNLGLPWRMLWYQFAPFEAYLAVDRAQETLALTNSVIADTASIEEVYYWRGRALAALGDEVGSQAAFRQALLLNPTYGPALAAVE